MNFEPIIGTFIGWIAGIQSNPSIFTYIGGFIVIVGNLIVTVAGHNKEKQTKSITQDTEKSLQTIDENSQNRLIDDEYI